MPHVVVSRNGPVAILTIQAAWGTNFSAAFIGAMVLSYIIKDRIKELGKRKFGPRIARFFPDHNLAISSSGTGAQLGLCKENFEVTKVSKLDEELRTLRYLELSSSHAIEGRPETVLRYTKRVLLSSQKLAAEMPGANGLTDIIRLNMAPLLARMDDPWETYRYVHPRTEELCETRCARVYHINVLLRLTAAGGERSLERVRVVMNKKGIVRVEPIRVQAFEAGPPETGLTGRIDPAMAT